MTPGLCVRLLGDFHLLHDESTVSDVDAPRLQSLLAYLVLHRHAPQSRRHLAFLFWYDSTEAQALTNLRNLLHHLRHALPEADRFLQVDAQTLQWQPDAPFVFDVAELESAIDEARRAEQAGDRSALRAALERAVALYNGDLLPSCYDDWILPERERLRQAFFDALERLILLLEGQRDYHAAIEHARRLLRYDPLHEATYRRLMRLYALSGDRAGALRVYHTCATLLQRELAVGPGAATREAYQRLLQAEAPPGATLPSGAELAGSLRMVGREREWMRLQEAWRAAAAKGPHFVLLSGEAGIGKTRLAEELLAWADRQGIATAGARCYGAEGELPYAPVATWLRAHALPALDDVWLTEVARLLPELRAGRPDLPAPAPLAEMWQRQGLFEALARAVAGGSQPRLLLIDDLQWCDRDTLEWLHYLLRFDPQARLLVVATLRTGESATASALAALLEALRRSDQLIELELGPLSQTEALSLAANLLGRELDPALASPLYQASEGNPFFVVEMARAGLSGGEPWDARHAQEKAAAAALPLPSKVRMVIEARLAQLSPSARELAGLAATIGREFTFAVLAQASDEEQDALVRDLDELWRRRIVRERGGEGYDFSHDQIREVAYAGLSAARRRLQHRRIAQALEMLYAGGSLASEPGPRSGQGLALVSAQVAVHYQRAGLPEQAIPYYRQAAEVAQRMYASQEAADLLTRALELLKDIPETRERDQRELELQIALGVPLILARGHAAPEVEQVYRRAQELCERVCEAPQRFQVLIGLRRFHFVRGDLQAAHGLGEQLLALAQSMGDPGYFSRAYAMHGETLYRMGAFTRSREHCVAGYDLYDPVQHRSHAFLYGNDTGVGCLVFGAMSLWYLGYPDQALREARAAVALAEDLDHPFTRCMSLFFVASLHRLRREVQATQEMAESAHQIATQYGFVLSLAWGGGLRGWTLVEQGRAIEGIDQMQQGLAACRSIGAGIELTNLLAHLSEAYGRIGKAEQALGLLNEAFTLMEASEERSWEAELYRLRGEALLRQGEQVDAEAAFRRAIDVAQRQGARSWELRAATSLARLWREQGKRAEAEELLRAVYDGFSEGLDTADLVEARALLQALT
ncbi:MAG: AAA family ATPase [Anaerolineae bacterium]|nr:AAA family ATPase [Anaerolineae bacterium]